MKKYKKFPKYERIDPGLYNLPSSQIRIGFEKDGNFYLDLEKLKYHMHVIGLTGTGKSFYLDLLMRQLLMIDRGFCLIDPLGFLYQAIVNFISHRPEYAERVIFWDPTKPSDYMVGYNPLQLPKVGSPMTHVKSLTSTMLNSFETDPVIAKKLRTTLMYSLIPTVSAGLTVAELVHFVTNDTRIRDVIKTYSNHPLVEGFWQKFDKLPASKKEEKLGSLEHRVTEFALTEMIKATMGQTSHTIDIPDIIENRKVLIINLSDSEWLEQDDAFLIGTMVVNDIYKYARRRQKSDAEANPYYLIIDEFQHFLTPTASKVLETCRQKGIHMVLAHQHLGQLKYPYDPADRIYQAVMSQARNKVIFATYSDDAEKLANFFRHEWPLDEVKHQIYRTTVLNYELEKHILESGGQVDMSASMSGSATGGATALGSGAVSGQSATIYGGPDQGFFAPEPIYSTLSNSISNYESAIDSWSDFNASQSGTADISGWHEALLLRPIMGKELASEELFTYDEQHFKQMQKLMALDTQWAVIKMVGEKSATVQIKTLLPYTEDVQQQAVVFKLSDAKHPNIYLPYKVRIDAWLNRVKKLKPAKPVLKFITQYKKKER